MGNYYDCPECGHEKCLSTCSQCPEHRKAPMNKQQAARVAYTYADAMLKARESRHDD